MIQDWDIKPLSNVCQTCEKPFADEINELQSTQTFGQRFQPALTKMWDDPHGRGFKVIAALWRVAAKQRK